MGSLLSTMLPPFAQRNHLPTVPTAQPTQSHRITAVALTSGIIALLVFISSMPPLGTAAYLAGLPLATEDLGVSTSAGQLTLTVYIIGMAFGQLVIGPLSDRVGRRTPLLIGILAFVLLSAAIAFSPTLEVMLVLRLAQGFAASSGMVLGRAIIHDLAQGDRAARALNVITAAGLVVPALAPLLGSAILTIGTWRSIFLILAALGLALGVWTLVTLPETRHMKAAQGGAPPGAAPRNNAGIPPSALRFVMYASVVALSFMAMYAYVSSAPFVFQQLHGFSPGGYAWTGAGLSLLMATVGILGSRLIGRQSRWGRISPARVVTIGMTWMMAGAALVMVSVYADASVAWYIAALAVAVAPVALVSGSATALAMDASPLAGGATSAIIGFSQAVLGAAAPPLVSILGVDARPMAVTFVGAAFLALAAAIIATFSARRSRIPAKPHSAAAATAEAPAAD